MREFIFTIFIICFTIFGFKPNGSKYRVVKQEVVNEPIASDHLTVFVDVII